MLTNTAIISYIGIIMFKYFGMNLFGSVINFYLIEKGFSYDYIIIIGTILTPLGIVVCIIGGKWLKRGSNQKMSIIMSIISF